MKRFLIVSLSAALFTACLNDGDESAPPPPLPGVYGYQASYGIEASRNADGLHRDSSITFDYALAVTFTDSAFSYRALYNGADSCTGSGSYTRSVFHEGSSVPFNDGKLTFLGPGYDLHLVRTRFACASADTSWSSTDSAAAHFYAVSTADSVGMVAASGDFLFEGTESNYQAFLARDWTAAGIIVSAQHSAPRTFYLKKP